MNKISSAEVRQLFLDYFKEKGHEVQASAPLVPIDDPSLLWINSGVATLKKYFDGTITPENPKIVNAQKAIRTNDIENVGFTARHHTFFEMLGNFSIGDYFKKEAIEYAWEFLTSEKWIGFDKDLLSVTVHPEDDEAYNIWLHDIKLPKERIIRLEENFWDIGEGPSGPNTEIFYDRGPTYGDDINDPELYPGGENERYLEVWNLVFSEFNHNPDDTYTPLPSKNIDTGMGLERLVSILQGAKTNFDTDLFIPIIKKTEEFTNYRYGKDAAHDTAFRIIADHIRTVAFAVGDHALPSNEGRGYILRRLIRRAVRYAKTLEINKPFMYELVPTVAEVMKDFYPEVNEQADHIMAIIKVEEERFHETLNDGLERLGKIIEEIKGNKKDVIPGLEVFKLYDTYGFPKELTDEYVQEYGFKIDSDGFEVEMQKQRERARNARDNTSSMQVQSEVLTQLDDESTFVGYETLVIETRLEKIITAESFVVEAKAGEEVFILLKETPFYAESGGQVSDQGIIEVPNGKVRVVGVQKAPQGQHIMQVVVEAGTIAVNETVTAEVDEEFRRNVIKNHTATHILHQALQDVLGDHIHQAGSLVTDKRLRFDISHFEAVTEEQLFQVERIVNEKIWQDIKVVIESKSIEEAKEMGAMALFGEKYGDVVRVVQIGDYSIELCGGCHVRRTSEIGLFKIVSESGIGAGVRRIEAIVGKQAFAWLEEKSDTLITVARLLKTNRDKIVQRIESIHTEISDLVKENESLKAKLANQEIAEVINNTYEVEGVTVLAEKVTVKDVNQLRNMMDQFKQKIPSSVILLVAENKGKVLLISGITDDLIKRNLHAGKLISEVAKVCGGGGGGRPDMAQAGGKDAAKINEALQVVDDYIKMNLK